MIGQGLLDVFFPRFCIACQQAIFKKSPMYLCEDCFQKIVFNRGAYCYYCGRAMGTEYDSVCMNCVELKPYFKEGISLIAYNAIERSFIHALKYNHGSYLKRDLNLLLEHESDRLKALKNASLVPVPLHFLRKWKRGYNQSEWIAKALQKLLGGEILPLLKRKVNTRSQTSLTRSERKKNVENVFTLAKKTIDPQKTYVLVDDVFTTGATLNACAKVLHENGAQNIRVFTLAHG